MSLASSSSLANESVVYSEAQRNGHDVGTGGTEAGDELLLRFREACKRADGLQPELNNPQKLALYGLFKQATDPNGRAPTAPSRLNLIARAKWEAWYEVRGLSLEHAMTAYIAMVEAVGDSSDGRPSRLGAVAAEPHRLQSVSASRGAHQLRADVAVAQHRVQAQAQHVRADMDHLVKLFAKSKYLAPHTPKLMRHKRVLLPHLQLLTPHLESLAPLLPRMLDWMHVLGPHLGEISRDLPLLLPHLDALLDEMPHLQRHMPAL